MRSFLLLALFFLSSCSHGPRPESLSHVELTDYVMSESLLTSALSSASVSATDSLQPLQNNVPGPVYKKLAKVLREHFKYHNLYSSVRTRLMAGASKEEMLEAAQDLQGRIWKKYLEGMEGNSHDQKKYSELYESLDEGKFDLTSQRAQLVAQITDHSYMVNLVRLSNEQVFRIIMSTMPPGGSEQQASVLAWIEMELKTLNESHIKTLFATNYLITENFTEDELEALLKIRSRQVVLLGKMALEDELNQRYHSFLKSMKELGKASMK